MKNLFAVLSQAPLFLILMPLAMTMAKRGRSTKIEENTASHPVDQILDGTGENGGARLDVAQALDDARAIPDGC